VASTAPKILTIEPGFVRGNRLGICFSGCVAALYLTLPFLPLDGPARVRLGLQVISAVGFCLFGATAWYAYRTKKRLPTSAIALDDDGIWPAHMPKDTALLRWTEIRSVRERRFRQCLELFDVVGRSRLKLDYYLTGFETLRAVLAEKTRLPLEQHPLPATFTKGASHHLFYIGCLVAFSLVGVYLGMTGRVVLGYGVMTLVAALCLHEYLTTTSGCVVAPGQLQVRYPLRRRVLRHDEVAAIRVSNPFRDKFGHPQVDVLARDAKRPIRLRARGVGTQELYHLLRRWKETSGT
jgi:hypothetical protein